MQRFLEGLGIGQFISPEKISFQECLGMYLSTAPSEPYPKSQLQGEH